MNEVVDIPSQYWLELVVAFDLQNTQDSQLDLPITPKAFRFRSFVKVTNSLLIDSGADHLLFSFYLKHIKSQYEMWSASRITVVKVIGPIKTDSFPYAKFKVVRGSSSQIDADIAAVLRKKLSVLPKDNPDGFDKMKLGKIQKNRWCVAFQLKERNDVDFQKVCFFLEDKHLYTTSSLEHILDSINKHMGNNKGDKKCFSDMIQWYIQVCKFLLGMSKRTEPARTGPNRTGTGNQLRLKSRTEPAQRFYRFPVPTGSCRVFKCWNRK
ncbi:unnamed protein product [Lactuca saligna]|uniref:Uncharacterized protein n=1 Tax=Lactuca saligna TaxID=75948 RepID=A0AA35Y6Q2_LACSI|nr:unnamed protein product [Lactuca saligna]